MRHQSVEAFDPSGHSAGGDTVNFVNVSERFALGKEIFVSAPVKLSRLGVLSEGSWYWTIFPSASKREAALVAAGWLR